MESHNNVSARGVISVLLFWGACVEVGGDGFSFLMSAANSRRLRFFKISIVSLKYNKTVLPLLSVLENCTYL